MQRRRAWLLLAFVALAGLLYSCATDNALPNSVDRPTPAVTETPTSEAADPLDGHSPRRPPLMPNRRAPVARDLQRLATMFVGYAVRDSDTFPHGESVSMAIGGHAVLTVDDIAAALSNREIWEICPTDWHVYGATSCPVDLLAPINNAVVNHARIVYSAEYSDVTCAPDRGGPLPSGRMVVLRPGPDRRTCTSDFALVLVADDEGLLRAIDLTLAEP